MEKQKTIVAAIAGAMALATISPAVAATTQQHGPTPYYQTQHHNDRWERRSDRRDHRYDRRAEREYRRDMAAERRWREQQWRYERNNRNDSNRNAAFAFVAGAVIGAIVQDQRGEHRQYYRDRNSGRYYYYNYDRRSYAWDNNFRPGYYR